MMKDVRNWRLVRETQDAIKVQALNDVISDVAYRHSDGHVVYDFPERIPQYVKIAIGRMFKKDYESLVGFYHEHGYNIHLQREGKLIDLLYEAGNSPYESVGTVPVERGEDLETLKGYCDQTGREMAAERGLPWAGCQREEDPDDGAD